MNEAQLRALIRKLYHEAIRDDKDEVDEITTTGDVEGYNTPFAFTGKKGQKKKKKISTNSTGYKVMKEELGKEDIIKIRKLIRDVVSNILRDIWLKRTAWNR